MNVGICVSLLAAECISCANRFPPDFVYAGLFGTARLILGEFDSKTSAFCVMFKSTNTCLHVCLVMPGCAIPKRTPPARLKAGNTSGLSRVELRNKKKILLQFHIVMTLSCLAE